VGEYLRSAIKFATNTRGKRGAILVEKLLVRRRDKEVPRPTSGNARKKKDAGEEPRGNTEDFEGKGTFPGFGEMGGKPDKKNMGGKGKKGRGTGG